MVQLPNISRSEKLWSFKIQDAIALSEREMTDFMDSHHAKIIGNHGPNGIYTDTFRIIDEDTWTIRVVIQS